MSSNSKGRVIIVGSGLGGLVCGYILAKNGYRVTVLEKHYQIGGCLQTFTRNGVKFDTGMHYIGSLEKGQILYTFFKYLDLLDNIKVVPLDRDGFDVFRIGNNTYRYAYGPEHFIDTMAAQFPNNREDIALYVRRIREIAEASFTHSLRHISEDSTINREALSTSYNDFIASCTDNPHLQAVLAANSFLYAGVWDKTPAYVMVHLNNFYIQSAYRILGGSDIIASCLARSIESMGGEVLTRAEVTEFVCDQKQMTHVELSDGRVLEADYFVSNVHPSITLSKIKSPLIRKVYRARITDMENTLSVFTLYIVFKKNSVKYNNYNFYFFDNEECIRSNRCNLETFPSSYLYIHQLSDEQNEFAESAEVITYMKYSDVSKWENSTVGRRGADYEAFKKECAEKMINKLDMQFPGIKDCIAYYYTSSPLTYRDYTATANGSLYGIAKDKGNPIQSRVSQRTKIPNFYFTGQNINLHGMLGVIVSAISTASEFVSIEKILSDIQNS